MAQLSIELWVEIFGYLSISDIARMCQLNQTANSEGQRIIVKRLAHAIRHGGENSTFRHVPLPVIMKAIDRTPAINILGRKGKIAIIVMGEDMLAKSDIKPFLTFLEGMKNDIYLGINMTSVDFIDQFIKAASTVCMEKIVKFTFSMHNLNPDNVAVNASLVIQTILYRCPNLRSLEAIQNAVFLRAHPEYIIPHPSLRSLTLHNTKIWWWKQMEKRVPRLVYLNITMEHFKNTYLELPELLHLHVTGTVEAMHCLLSELRNSAKAIPNIMSLTIVLIRDSFDNTIMELFESRSSLVRIRGFAENTSKHWKKDSTGNVVEYECGCIKGSICPEDEMLREAVWASDSE